MDFAGDRVGEKVWKGCRWFSVFEDNLIALDYLFYFIFSSRRDEGILSKERERESETVIFISKEKYIFIYFNELNKRRKCF